MVRYQELRTFYELDKTIGSGGFAKVKLGTHVLTGEKVAIKIMDKAALREDYPRVKLEIEALKNISHKHICKLYQVIESETHYFMVMEYCSGGELFDHIVEKQKLPEVEARKFFRQILSAVAYLHKMGYAHRDLKPENILLDSEMNLKIIDFGLCAKPLGGISSLLKTSCGSPMYAAPELIKGINYLGSEIDVWSMGVMLYALHCGFLPFDCDNIENLYKKILKGSYDEPPWLSKSCRNIIRSMLQVDPRKRITIEELLSHSWVTAGYKDPVLLKPQHKDRVRCDDIVDLMSKHYMMTSSELWERVSKWAYDYDTATYLLLLGRRNSGLNLRIYNRPFTIRSRLRYRNPPEQSSATRKSVENTLSPSSRESYVKLRAAIEENECGKENALRTPLRTVRKRVHPDDDCSSPVPKKITPGKIQKTPNVDKTQGNQSTPSKKFLCTIERKINQVRNVLTPRKKVNSAAKGDHMTPVTLTTKNLCNVSTASSTDPKQVLEDLKTALQEKNVQCEVTGFRIRGKVDKGQGRNCSFEVEICYIEASDKLVVGIRRRRLRGDSWCYKQICEQILSITQCHRLIS